MTTENFIGILSYNQCVELTATFSRAAASPYEHKTATVCTIHPLSTSFKQFRGVSAGIFK